VIWPRCFVSRSGRQTPVISLRRSTAGSVRALMSVSCVGRRHWSRACRRHFHDAHAARTRPLYAAQSCSQLKIGGWLMSSDECRLMADFVEKLPSAGCSVYYWRWRARGGSTSCMLLAPKAVVADFFNKIGTFRNYSKGPLKWGTSDAAFLKASCR
jgi:hypothetical protein